jgi:radical SAM superfamily enzyme YgiQ (UPF0313 family)
VSTNQFAHIQHGIAGIAAVLRKAGHETALIWIREEIEPEQLIMRVSEIAPGIIGFSSTTLQWPFTRKYAKVLKGALPEIPLIIGGVHATLDSERVWSEGIFDFLCVGEGEYAMRDLLDALSQGRNYRAVQNLWVRDRGETIKNPLRAWIEPLDDLPFPDRSIWDNDLILGENDHEAALMASRGCPYSCTYCSNSVLRGLPAAGRHVRIKSPEYVIEEIADLTTKYDVRSLFFEDEIFTLKKSWVDKFCELYKARFKMPFIVYVRQELVDREMLQKLKDAGCSAIKLGVETGNEKLRLEVLGRKTSNAEIIKFFRTAHEVGLKTWIFNMVGIPGETLDTIEETMELNYIIKANHVQVTMFYPFPGTKLYELCRENGYLGAQESPSVFYEYSVLNLPTIGVDELHQAFLRFRKLSLEIMSERAALGDFDLCHRFPEAKVKTEHPAYVQLMPVRVNGVERMSVLAHPPARITYRIPLRPASVLRFGIAFSPTVWNKPGRGTTFEIRLKSGIFRDKKIFEKYIDPKNIPEDRRWHDHELNLSEWGGKTVELILITKTEAGQNEYCVAAWSKPHIIASLQDHGRG